MNIFSNLSPILQSFIAGTFTFLLTVLGAGIIFLFKKINKTLMDAMLAISAGIMLSASFFSLIIPAISDDTCNGFFSIIYVIAFFLGSLSLYFGNNFLNKKLDKENYSKLKRCILLFFSITMHNIPEGLVIGVAFGSVYYKSSSLIAALLLTLGIGIQNFPEGSAISLPLNRDGISKNKAFLFGVLSGIVEPISAIIGAFLILKIKKLLPLIMLFTAGAMIYVIIIELIPESQKNKKEGLMALLNIIGFSFMMFLELILG